MTEKKSPIISFKNFSFQYRAQKKPTLKEINLDIYPGERVLIAGPSGCGKSTLAGCINGLNPFSNPGECSGELIVDGVDAPKSSIFQLSAHVGTVLQDPDVQQAAGIVQGGDGPLETIFYQNIQAVLRPDLKFPCPLRDRLFSQRQLTRQAALIILVILEPCFFAEPRYRRRGDKRAPRQLVNAHLHSLFRILQHIIDDAALCGAG